MKLQRISIELAVFLMIALVAFGGFANLQSSDEYSSDLSGYVTVAQMPITDAILTPTNAHINSPACPAGYTSTGYLADCGAAKCRGNQVLCIKKDSTSPPISDMILTTQNAHINLPACPAGYTLKGNLADCGAGKCSGNQVLCIKKGGEFALTNAILTPTNAHQLNPKCASGYTSKGSLADCGAAKCYGVQLLCTTPIMTAKTPAEIAKPIINLSVTQPSKQIQPESSNICGTDNAGKIICSTPCNAGEIVYDPCGKGYECGRAKINRVLTSKDWKKGNLLKPAININPRNFCYGVPLSGGMPGGVGAVSTVSSGQAQSSKQDEQQVALWGQQGHGGATSARDLRTGGYDQYASAQQTQSNQVASIPNSGVPPKERWFPAGYVS